MLVELHLEEGQASTVLILDGPDRPCPSPWTYPSVTTGQLPTMTLL